MCHNRDEVAPELDGDVYVLLDFCRIWGYGVVAPADVHVHNSVLC